MVAALCKIPWILGCFSLGSQLSHMVWWYGSLAAFGCCPNPPGFQPQWYRPEPTAIAGWGRTGIIKLITLDFVYKECPNMFGLFGKPLFQKPWDFQGLQNVWKTRYEYHSTKPAPSHAVRLNFLRFFQISQHGINFGGLKGITSRWNCHDAMTWWNCPMTLSILCAELSRQSHFRRRPINMGSWANIGENRRKQGRRCYFRRQHMQHDAQRNPAPAPSILPWRITSWKARYSNTHTHTHNKRSRIWTSKLLNSGPIWSYVVLENLWNTFS